MLRLNTNQRKNIMICGSSGIDNNVVDPITPTTRARRRLPSRKTSISNTNSGYDKERPAGSNRYVIKAILDDNGVFMRLAKVSVKGSGGYDNKGTRDGGKNSSVLKKSKNNKNNKKRDDDDNDYSLDFTGKLLGKNWIKVDKNESDDDSFSSVSSSYYDDDDDYEDYDIPQPVLKSSPL